VELRRACSVRPCKTHSRLCLGGMSGLTTTLPTHLLLRLISYYTTETFPIILQHNATRSPCHVGSDREHLHDSWRLGLVNSTVAIVSTTYYLTGSLVNFKSSERWDHMLATLYLTCIVRKTLITPLKGNCADIGIS
jgi:hypothetical protein